MQPLRLNGEAMKVDHVTAIVPDASAAADAMRRLLGQEPVATVSLPGMDIRSFRVGDVEIHVNAPTGDGPVQDHFRAHGPSFHHVALRVDDLEQTLNALSARGFSALGQPVETAPGLREVFLDPRTAGGMLIQLVERTNTGTESYKVDSSAVSKLVEQGTSTPDTR
jgi:methylmalonyl-CoA/ethylmalonyl-CoA epimerase